MRDRRQRKGDAPAEISVKRCRAAKMRERIVIRTTETPTCSKVDVAGYLLTPLQDRREIGDAQTQWTHLGVIRHRICTVELLIYWRLYRRRDNDGFRLNTHIGRKYVSLQGLLRTWPKYGREVVAERRSDAKDTKAWKPT